MDGSTQAAYPTQQSRSISKKQVIVYDPTRQTVTIQDGQKLEALQVISTQTLPRFSSRVNIWVEEDDPPKRKSFVATLNLSKLGWGVKFRRLCGTVDQLYVMELPGGPRSLLDAAAAG